MHESDESVSLKSDKPLFVLFIAISRYIAIYFASKLFFCKIYSGTGTVQYCAH